MFQSAAKALREAAARKAANRDLNFVIAILLMRFADRKGSAGARLIEKPIGAMPHHPLICEEI
jgi:hypothetical protein